ncbi:hypothetical protein A2U01_0052623, partial [Trifolium medium]|nr:hypothetical protein [Trifolium medium]
MLQLDPALTSFLEIARWRLESQSEQEVVETENHKEKSNVTIFPKQIDVANNLLCVPVLLK